MSAADLRWQRHAACRDHDPDLFFAPEIERREDRQVREAHAKAICGSCAVSGPCLEYRLTFKTQRDGDIWAGYDGEQRAGLRNAMLKRQQRQERRAA